MRQLTVSILFIFLSAGCIVRYAYYQSPLQGNATSYREVPTQRDSVKSAIYGSAVMGGGGANHLMNDGVSSFSASVHRSHNLDHFQAYYGGSIVGGTYDVNRMINGSGMLLNESVDTALLNANTGTRGYFSAGAFGGLNLVKKTTRGEWRIIGAEMTWHSESGSYYRFRKMLPDTSANFIERRNDFVAIGVHTDVVWTIPDGSLGVKMGIVLSTRSGPGFDKDGQPEIFSSGYFSKTIHVQKKKVTGFLQLNFGGYATLVFLGANYRLSKL